MLAKTSAWIQRNLPTREQMERSKWIKPFANRVLRSELWRFTRRSVPRGVALGMIVGIIMPFAQILIAALLCLSVRANVPVAALTTFVTNPVTVATAVNEGEISPLVRSLADVLISALSGILKYL